MKNKKVVIQSRIPELCKEREFTRKEFVRLCVSNNICGIDAAKRLYRGDHQVRLKTAVEVSVLVFGTKLPDVFLANLVKV